MFAALAYLCAPATVFAQAIDDLEISTPRDFGYTIGDKIRHEMQISIRQPFQLDRNSLPETGRLNRWLEISAANATVVSRGEVDTYRITIDYQLFNVPRELSRVTIPQLEFVLSGGDNPLPVFLPEWTFSIAPIATVGPHRELMLQPDRKPIPIAVGPRRVQIWGSTILLVALLFYLAFWQWVLPRLRSSRYPFTNALDKLRRLPRSASGTEHYKLGVRTFHAAMNATARQVVFDYNLPDFLSAHPQYAMLEVDLAAFFARSRDLFFDDAPVAAPDAELLELIELCRQCRTLERSVA